MGVAVTAAAAVVTVVNPATPAPLTVAAKLAKQAKGMATVQARCESLAFEAHAQLGYEEWYIEEAMVYQASECLSSNIVKWFDVCENYCTSCNDARKCEADGNEECSWWGGACHFGERIATDFNIILKLTGVKYTDFVADASNEPRLAAQQMLDWILEGYSDVWAELTEEEPTTPEGDGVTITAKVWHTDALQTRDFIDAQEDLVKLAVSKWNVGSMSVVSRRRLAVHPVTGEIVPPAEADCGNAGCEACDATNCAIQSDCGLFGQVQTCGFKQCTALLCGSCATEDLCKAADPCFWDDDDDDDYFAADECKGCSVLSCSDCPDHNTCETAHCDWDKDASQCNRRLCTSSSCGSCYKDSACTTVGCTWTGTCAPTPSANATAS